MRHILSVDDLAGGEVRAILDRAAELDAGAATSVHPFDAALLFLSPSMRTRVGYTVAVHRLGGRPVDAVEQRFSPVMSAPESVADTIRVLSGMVDVLVARVPVALSEEVAAAQPLCPVINGADTHDHPTQGLIDLAAVEAEKGSVGDLTIALCGDLTQRSAMSLIGLLDREPPRRLILSAPPTRSYDVTGLGSDLRAVTEVRDPDDVEDVDVLYLPGFPPGRGDEHLDDAARAPYVLTGERADRLPDDAVVLCPLPAIDEVDPVARQNPRIAMWRQSDRGVAVRMAVLETVLAWGA